MAKKITQLVELTDDLDGSTATTTVSFSYDGTNYEIDLSKKNKTAMDKAFKPYLDHARKVRSSRGRRSPGSTGPKRNLAAVREWAKEQGLAVSDRGRISAEIQQQYDAAH